MATSWSAQGLLQWRKKELPWVPTHQLSAYILPSSNFSAISPPSKAKIKQILLKFLNERSLTRLKTDLNCQYIMHRTQHGNILYRKELIKVSKRNKSHCFYKYYLVSIHIFHSSDFILYFLGKSLFMTISGTAYFHNSLQPSRQAYLYSLVNYESFLQC